MRANRKDRFVPFDQAADQAQLDAVLAGYDLAYALIATVSGGQLTVRTEAGIPGAGARVLEALVPTLTGSNALMVVADARADPRLASTDMVTGDPALVSLMASVLRSSDDSAVGVIVVADTAPRDFGPLAIGRMHLGIGVLESQFADIQEATRAHGVQRALLPMMATVPVGYEFDGCSILHGQITGAYFDWHEVSEGVIGFGLTESTGSGVGAGLIAAAARSCLRSAALLGAAAHSDLVDTVALTSRALSDDLSVANARVSLLYGTLSPATGEIKFVNAGLEPPLVLRSVDAQPRPIAEYSTATRSISLGSGEDPMRTTESITLGVGDTLVVASASAWAVLAATRSSGQSASEVTDAVEAWARTHPEYKGVALVAITRTAPAEP